MRWPPPRESSTYLYHLTSFLPSSRSFLAEASKSMIFGTNLTRFFFDAFIGIKSGWEWFFSRSFWVHRFSWAARRRLANLNRSWVDRDASGVAGVGGGDGGAVNITVGPPESIIRLMATLLEFWSRTIVREASGVCKYRDTGADN